MEGGIVAKADSIFFQVSVMTDAVALPANMTSSLTAARGSYVHSALNIGKGAMSGISKIAGR